MVATLDPKRRILLKDLKDTSIHTYESEGGYAAIKKALSMDRKKVIEEVKLSGLRGRGGAGFPTGNKWSFVPENSKFAVYLLCNADESEPGTFKDRLLMETNPHQLIEGMMIGSFAIGSHKNYIYIRGEYVKASKILEKAIDEAYSRGYLGKKLMGHPYSLDIVLHRGAGAYICGEETGLISSLEGKKGYPKLKPPFPAVSGFLNSPTIVNNVETLSTIPWIMTNGGAAYSAYGTKESKGTRLYCLSGWVNKPGTYEEELGISLKTLIDHYGGGLKNGAELKAVIPGGSSTPPLTKEEALTITMDFESLARAGSFLGSGGIIVIPEHMCLVSIVEKLSEFYWDESCGQCTPCREGTGWLYKMLKSIEHGSGTEKDLENLKKTAGQMMGTTICALSDAAAMPVLGFLKKFRAEFDAHIRDKKCPYGETHA